MVMLGAGKGQWQEGREGLGYPALFRDELPFFVEGMYIVLFVWRQRGSVCEWFEQGHCFVCGSIFVPVVVDV
jgi:hypothetical protein